MIIVKIFLMKWLCVRIMQAIIRCIMLLYLNITMHNGMPLGGISGIFPMRLAAFTLKHRFAF